ncbi:hypothetical protein ACW5UC_24625 [Priestia aryabhattai]|uniref:hypothetical protein n=1 Tax=Priestia megaterium TaxID=1404 RepID=UPI003F9B8394
MKKITLEEARTIRGFKALTQGEERVEQMLVENINKLDGEIRGFNATRKHLLHNEFNRKALEQVSKMFLEAKRKGISIEKDKMLKGVAKDLWEKVFRHQVTSDQALVFGDSTVNRIQLCGDIHKACNTIEKYFTQGEVVPVALVEREAEAELEKGAIIYDVPRSEIG